MKVNKALLGAVIFFLALLLLGGCATTDSKGVLKNKGSTYEGDIKDGKPNGYGTCYFANGNRYEGEFRDGKVGVHIVSFRYTLSDHGSADEELVGAV